MLSYTAPVRLWDASSPRGPALGRTAAAICVAVSGLACWAPARGPRTPEPIQAEPPPPTLELLSAQLSAVDEGPRRDDQLILVFAHEIDPLTLAPGHFFVTRADGRRVAPTHAVLGPADEGDENRSVTLVGAFGEFGQTRASDPSADVGPVPRPPVAVHVYGKLYAETGEALDGLDAEIRPFDAADRPVYAELLPATPSRCADAAAVVRTYWSDALSGVSLGDLKGIHLTATDGHELSPDEFDDHAGVEPTADPAAASPPPQSVVWPTRPDDNVLDLCVKDERTIVKVTFDAGLFTDLSQHKTAGASIPVSPLPSTATEDPPALDLTARPAHD